MCHNTKLQIKDIVEFWNDDGVSCAFKVLQIEDMYMDHCFVQLLIVELLKTKSSKNLNIDYVVGTQFCLAPQECIE